MRCERRMRGESGHKRWLIWKGFVNKSGGIQFKLYFIAHLYWGEFVMVWFGCRSQLIPFAVGRIGGIKVKFSF